MGPLPFEWAVHVAYVGCFGKLGVMVTYTRSNVLLVKMGGPLVEVGVDVRGRVAGVTYYVMTR